MPNRAILPVGLSPYSPTGELWSNDMVSAPEISALGQLRENGCQVVPIREELRRNLIGKIRAEEIVFPGIIGFNDTVIPQLETVRTQ